MGVGWRARTLVENAPNIANTQAIAPLVNEKCRTTGAALREAWPAISDPSTNSGSGRHPKGNPPFDVSLPDDNNQSSGEVDSREIEAAEFPNSNAAGVEQFAYGDVAQLEFGRCGRDPRMVEQHFEILRTEYCRKSRWASGRGEALGRVGAQSTRGAHEGEVLAKRGDSAGDGARSQTLCRAERDVAAQLGPLHLAWVVQLAALAPCNEIVEIAAIGRSRV